MTNVTRAIKFNTGRQYAPEGQIVVAYQLGDPFEDMGFTWHNVRFVDLTRGVSGEFTVTELSERTVMHHYDHGYKNVWITDAEKEAAFSLVGLDSDGIPL